MWLPWDVCCRSGYAWFPPLTEFMVLALFICAIAHWARTQRLRVPFELAWPALLVVFLAWAGAATGSESRPLRVTGLVLVYLATVQAMGSRAAAGRCLAAFLGSSGMLALFSLAARTFWSGALHPAGYDLGTGVTVHAARTVADGVWTLAAAAILGAAFAARGGMRPRDRALAGIAGFLCLAALAQTLSPAHALRGLPFDLRLPGEEPAAWTMLLVTVWLVARTAARLAVERIETPEPALLPVLAATTAAGLLFLLLPVESRLLHVMLLAVAAGAATRRTEPPPGALAPLVFAPLLLFLVLCGAMSPDRDNPSDPRNYDFAAAADLEAGRLDLLEQRLEYFESLHREERRTHYWRARIALERGHTRTAATELRAAVAGITLPPVKIRKWTRPVMVWNADEGGQEVQEVRREIRDLLSAGPQPVPHLAHERLLAADMDASAVAQLMRSRLRQSVSRFAGQEDALDRLPGKPFARALAFLAGRDREHAAFDAWTPSEMILVLEQCGAEFVFIGGDADYPAALPVVCAAYTEPGCLRVHKGNVTGGIVRAVLSPGTGATTTWHVDTASGRVELRVEERPGMPPLVVSNLDGSMFATEAWNPRLDDHTAILVCLPPLE
jgi:hypothetical protein